MDKVFSHRHLFFIWHVKTLRNTFAGRFGIWHVSKGQSFRQVPIAPGIQHMLTAKSIRYRLLTASYHKEENKVISELLLIGKKLSYFIQLYTLNAIRPSRNSCCICWYMSHWWVASHWQKNWHDPPVNVLNDLLCLNIANIMWI